MRLELETFCASIEVSYVHNEAVAYEQASRFYRARGLDQIADLYLQNARRCYERWGADGKVRQIDAGYPLRDKPQLISN